MAVQVNPNGRGHANALIERGEYDATSDWSFTADDGNKLLGANGDDWANYIQFFLAEDTAEAVNTKARYKYPFGKDGKVYRSALTAIRQRSAQQDETAIFDLAGGLIAAIDAKEQNKGMKKGPMTKRAYSTLEIKAVTENGKRVIRGIASTPTPDRMGDIVVPQGAKFKLPIPLLWQHDPDNPIGWINQATVTSKGISIVGEVAQLDDSQDGKLKQFLDYAWQSIQANLVRGLSIGFNPLKYSQIEGTWSFQYDEWEWLELSTVTIPANAEASITAIKSADLSQRAALGANKRKVARLPASQKSASAVAPKKVTTIQKGNTKMKSVAEQIEAFETQRSELVAKQATIMQTASDEGRTLDETEAQEYDAAQADIDSIDKHLPRLKTLQKSLASKASPVAGNNEREGERSRQPIATVRNTQKLDKGIEFARYAMCLGVAKGNIHQAYEISKSRYPEMERINTVLKAAVEAGTTTDPQWAGPLVQYNEFAGDFVDYLRPMTIIGQFGTTQNGVAIPALRSVPFNIHIKGQVSGGNGYWVGEGKAKPVTSFDFNDVYLSWAKVANIAVLTEELLRFSNPSAEALVRQALADALIERLDIDFIDPNKAAVANVSPASITRTAPAFPSSGNDADAVRRDLATLWGPFIAAHIRPTSAVYIMDSSTALRLSLMRNALGQVEFPGISIRGGTLEGIPVIVSDYVPSTSAGSLVILANASDIWLADDGQVVIDASREASLQMDSAPTNDSPTPTPTTLVSMFQTNSIALRAERFINWQLRRSAAVSYLNDVNWGEETGT